MTRATYRLALLAVCGLLMGCSDKREADAARAEAAKARAEAEALRDEVAALRAGGKAAAEKAEKPPTAANRVKPADYASLKELLQALPEAQRPRQSAAEERQDAVGEWFARHAPQKIVRFRAVYNEGQRSADGSVTTSWTTKEDLGLPGAVVLPLAIFTPRVDQEDELKSLRPGTERTVQGWLVMVDVRPFGEKGKYLLEVRLGDAEFADR